MDSKKAVVNKKGAPPWNKGKLVGQKAPLRLGEIWAIRVRLELLGHVRDLALFNLAIDSKLRGCDLVKLKVQDISQGGRVGGRAIVMQQKTRQPVQFELSRGTRASLISWLHTRGLRGGDFLFPSRVHDSPTSPHDSTQGLFIDGWKRSVLTHPATARIQCAGRNRH